MDSSAAVSEAFSASIKFARAAERIRAVVSAIDPVGAALNAVLELDPELEPEITAVREHMRDSIETLTRGLVVLDARLDVTMRDLLERT